MCLVLKPDKEGIIKASKLIKEGKIVAFPTETVYGLGADVFNKEAVARIFEVKKRPFFDPIIVHIADFSDVEKLCTDIPEKAKKLMERFWPGPLTIILKKTEKVPYIVTAGLETVGIRMPSHSVAMELIRSSGTPIAAPSANSFGQLSPTEAKHVIEDLGDEIDAVIDGGKTFKGIESTVIDVMTEVPEILRPGAVPVEEIEKVIGKVEIRTLGGKIKSPGQIEKHYAPRTPLKIICEERFIPPKGLKKALLAFKKPSKLEKFSFDKILYLSEKGDLVEAAYNLFSYLHELDKGGFDIIYAEKVPEKGLGIAIMDRLKKAESGQ